jgi:hypothetical protein
MTRGARWFVGLAFIEIAGAATAAGGTDDAPQRTAGRHACLATASEAELRVDATDPSETGSESRAPGILAVRCSANPRK